MKKIFYIISILLIVSCQPDEIFEPINTIVEIPESLKIEEDLGVKLESVIVTDEVRMNVKLPYTGQYRLKIRHGLNGELISQEKITSESGDNLLKVYVSTLDKSGYRLELTDSEHKLLARTSFVVN